MDICKAHIILATSIVGTDKRIIIAKCLREVIWIHCTLLCIEIAIWWHLFLRLFNSLWLSHVIGRWRSWSALFKVKVGAIKPLSKPMWIHYKWRLLHCPKGSFHRNNKDLYKSLNLVHNCTLSTRLFKRIRYYICVPCFCLNKYIMLIQYISVGITCVRWRGPGNCPCVNMDYEIWGGILIVKMAFNT